MKKTTCERQEYKGNEVIAIYLLDKEGNKNARIPPFAFGKSKARMILENIETIREFVEGSDHDSN